MKNSRKKIPKALEHAVREQCGQACARPECREWSTATHELHHIDGNPSNNILDNLILLCGSCHNKVGAIFSESDIRFWKRMAETGFLPPAKGQPAGNNSIHIEKNEGVVGNTVNIGTVKVTQPKPKTRKGIPGTIGGNLDMETYAEYLVGKYIDWRKKGQRIDKRKFASGSAHGILAEGFGCRSVMLIPESRFFDFVAQAQAKIDRTVWGKNNKYRNYHSWEEHLAQRHGDTGTRN